MNTNRKLEVETSLLKKKDVEFLLTSYKKLIRMLCESDVITQSGKDPDDHLNPVKYAFIAGQAFTIKMVLATYCGMKEADLNELEEDIKNDLVCNMAPDCDSDADTGNNNASDRTE